MAVVANVDADLANGGVKHGKVVVAWTEVELLPEATDVRDVMLAVLAEIRAVRVDDSCRVVKESCHLALVHREHHDQPEFFGECLEPLGGWSVWDCLRVVVVLDVLNLAEIWSVEQLLETDDLGSIGCGLSSIFLMELDHGLLVTGPLGLENCCAHDSTHPLSPSHSVGANCLPHAATCTPYKIGIGFGAARGIFDHVRRTISRSHCATGRADSNRTWTKAFAGPTQPRAEDNRGPMNIGVITEVKPDERRVAIQPGAAHDLVLRGHSVFIQSAAGAGARAPDVAFEEAGADILDTAQDVFDASQLIVHVKEPQDSEIAMLTPDHTLFTYLHLAAYPKVAEGLVASGATCIAYETVVSNGTLPLLTPMSHIAGRLSTQVGAFYLMAPNGGKGVLLGGYAGVPQGQVS
jgi:hypothetical protein